MCRIYGDWFAPHWLVMISDSGKLKNFDSFALDKLQFQGNGVKLSIIEDRAARMSISDVCVCLVEIGWNPYLLIEICEIGWGKKSQQVSLRSSVILWWCVVLHIRICFVHGSTLKTKVNEKINQPPVRPSAECYGEEKDSRLINAAKSCWVLVPRIFCSWWFSGSHPYLAR